MHNISTSEIPGQRDILCRQTSTCWRMYQVLVWWVSCWLASNQHHTSLADGKSRLLPSKMKQNHISNVKPISSFSWAMIIVFLTMVVVHAFRRQKHYFCDANFYPTNTEIQSDRAFSASHRSWASCIGRVLFTALWSSLKSLFIRSSAPLTLKI